MIDFTQKLNAALHIVPDDCQIYLLLIPHAIQVSKTYQERFLQLGAKLIQPDSLLTATYPFAQYLQNHLTEKHIQIINPLSHLQESDPLFSVYYDNDPHLNPKGQALVGKFVLEVLSSDQINTEEDL